jgi:uncharacterized membrane protein
MGNTPENIAKLLIFAGIVLILAGIAFFLFGKIGIFKLPGDVAVGGRNWKFYFPITSCLVISFILTVVFWLIGLLRK